MAAHPLPSLMTAEEFYELPERDDVKLELHWGQLVELAQPKYWHVKLQRHLAKLLEARAGSDWSVVIEMPFRALPQYEVRAADIGVVSRTREDAVGNGDLSGSPEIVVEILSPSNRRKDISERMALFLSTGTKQFCVVDRERRTVSVTGNDNRTQVYQGDDEVPFPLLRARLRVSEIWAE